MQWKPGAQQQSLLMIRLYLFTQASFCSITTWCRTTARRSIGRFAVRSPSSHYMGSLLFPTGVAGSVATVLHDAVMNPAEGKNSRIKTSLLPSSFLSFLFFFFFSILTKLSWLFLNKTRLQDCLVKETDWSAVTVSLDLYIEQNPYPTWAHNEPRDNPECKLLLKALMQLAALCERRQSCSFPTVAAERCRVSISNEHCVSLCGLLSWHGALAQKMMCTLVGNWCECPD